MKKTVFALLGLPLIALANTEEQQVVEVDDRIPVHLEAKQFNHAYLTQTNAKDFVKTLAKNKKIYWIEHQINSVTPVINFNTAFFNDENITAESKIAKAVELHNQTSSRTLKSGRALQAYSCDKNTLLVAPIKSALAESKSLNLRNCQLMVSNIVTEYFIDGKPYDENKPIEAQIDTQKTTVTPPPMPEEQPADGNPYY